MDSKSLKRVFICGDFKFPHGDAVANRMHFIAKMINESNMEAYIISVGDNKAEEWDETAQIYIHDNIKYANVKRRSGNGWDFFQRGVRAAELLKKYHITEHDIIYISSIWPHYTQCIRNRIHVKPSFVFDVMEWFQPFQFRGGRLNLWYQAYNYFFTHTVLGGDRVVVISHELQNYYTEKGKKVFCLPLVLDPFSYPTKERKNTSVSKFIYPGNPGKKDAMHIMLKGLKLLDRNERQNVEFHITGVKKETLIQILGTDSAILEQNQDIVRFHGWLDYAKLYQLYNDMNFFLLAKEDNLVTKSNFPSKVPELMSCGVIPVMNNVGDVSEYLTNNKDSILYETCTAESCVKGIRKALSLSDIQKSEMSHAARYCAEEKFNYKIWSKEFTKFLCGE